MQIVGTVIDVLGVLLLLKEFLWPAAQKVLGLDKKLVGTNVASKALVKAKGKWAQFPKFFVSLFEKGGKLRWVRDIAFFLKNTISGPVILGIMFVLSAFFPTLAEKIFMIVGAVAMKLAIVMVRWGSNVLSNAPENNVQELYTILGTTVDGIPHCFIDILGYCHLVENLGMIISTAVFCGIYNLIKYFYFKWL